ncbi:MAG: glutamate synthase central domain-containing protein, partial [Nitrospinota bacterium]
MKQKKFFPEKQGMYDPRLEKDSCGVGFVAHMKGNKSHTIIEDGLTILDNLAHRGATGSDPETGDGAGILFQIPHKFFTKVVKKENISLPDPGKYGVGMVFLPQDQAEQTAVKKIIENTLTEENQENLGWRDVPVDPDAPGRIAKQGMPAIFQIFIKCANTDPLSFERKLYVIRKIVGEKVRKLNLRQARLFHIPSFSSRTIVYKGQLIAHQVPQFFPDLADPDMESAVALVHQRYSTNTFPSWDLAHPFRFLAHNGEINTLRGNINWMASREAMFESEMFGDDIKKIFPVIRPYGSDSSCFDNALELLVLSGRSLPHAMMMLIPEAWGKDTHIDETKKAFYEFHAAKMEPWDGPAAMAFTDGEIIWATLDRNGLRPARYLITRDDRIILASEEGTLPINPSDIVQSWRLQPGKILVCDLKKGRILDDKEVKDEVSRKRPYKKWVDENSVRLDDLPNPPGFTTRKVEDLTQIQKIFGYTEEAVNKIIIPMSETGMEPIGSMGAD